jgi:uncharacterized membrane protein
MEALMTMDSPTDGTPAPPPPPSTPGSPPPPPPAAEGPTGGPPAGGSDNTVMLILSYLGLLALIPFLVEKEDREVMWHARHGLVLTVAEVVFFIVLTIITMVAGFIPVIGCVFALLPMVAALGVIVLHVVCIMKALKGERFLIPNLSEFADKF